MITKPWFPHFLTFHLASLRSVVVLLSAQLAGETRHKSSLGTSSFSCFISPKWVFSALKLSRHFPQQEILLPRAITASSRRGGVGWGDWLRSRRNHSCDNRGTPINVNSGLMTDVIDSAIDDQNAALTAILIERKWELITPDRKQHCSVCVCVCPCQRQYICVFQSNLSPVTVVRRSQVGLLTSAVTWEETNSFFFRFHAQFSLLFLWNFYLRGTRRAGNEETRVLCRATPGSAFPVINYSHLNDFSSGTVDLVWRTVKVGEKWRKEVRLSCFQIKGQGEL